jgi:DNA-binding transcriptional ArsR family regulator
LSTISKLKHRGYNWFNAKEDDMAKEPDYSDLLQGKTLKIYWNLLRHGEMGIRELQKVLAVSSPGTITYQIKKLIEAGLVEQNENSQKYYVKEEIKTGILGFYVRVGYKLFPRFSLYLLFFFVGILWFLLNTIDQGDTYFLDNFVYLLFLLGGVGIFIFESYRIWRMKPE